MRVREVGARHGGPAGGFLCLAPHTDAHIAPEVGWSKSSTTCASLHSPSFKLYQASTSHLPTVSWREHTISGPGAVIHWWPTWTIANAPTSWGRVAMIVLACDKGIREAGHTTKRAEERKKEKRDTSTMDVPEPKAQADIEVEKISRMTSSEESEAREGEAEGDAPLEFHEQKTHFTGMYFSLPFTFFEHFESLLGTSPSRESPTFATPQIPPKWLITQLLRRLNLNQSGMLQQIGYAGGITSYRCARAHAGFMPGS
ncbi:hypothetical protein BJ912DRAFT_1060912 [Pholiota molesta]|nr:hypothetical protein BJ912DRAFT_1060912 [Pholiota molesta]